MPIKPKGFEGIWDNLISVKDTEGLGENAFSKVLNLLLELKITHNCIGCFGMSLNML